MLRIKIATEANSEVLALLGRITYTESHSSFIADKNDLLEYNKTAFSLATIIQDINNPNNRFYIIYMDDLPVGYAKLILNLSNENVPSKKGCRLDKIYILDDFIPLKIGQELMTFVEDQARELGMDTIWLVVYLKNSRAIRFYERNQYKKVGDLIFMVNQKAYDNLVFSKKIDV